MKLRKVETGERTRSRSGGEGTMSGGRPVVRVEVFSDFT